MCGTGQPKEQQQIGDRGSNPVGIDQFLIFFSLLGPHLLVLFSICQYSLFYAQPFFTENGAGIKEFFKQNPNQ